jgi:hypothetical protein
MGKRSVVNPVIDGNKTCTKCMVKKDLSDFSRDNRSKCGLQARCKACYRLYDSARADYRRNKPGAHDKAHGRYLNRTYGLSRDEYANILLTQDGRCAICRTDTPGEIIKEWAVDHDHACCPGKKSCGKCVRGLLCRACNSGIGALKDNVDVLYKAIEYLTSCRSALKKVA